jgi:hypothetical protein
MWITTTYHAVRLFDQGGPRVLQIAGLPAGHPGPGQPRVCLKASGVGANPFDPAAWFIGPLAWFRFRCSHCKDKPW